MLVAVVHLAGGCKSNCCRSTSGKARICPENLERGYATILCQPLDTDVDCEVDKAVLTVESDGNQQSYQWYFVNANGVTTEIGSEEKGTYQNAKTKSLTIRKPSYAELGDYYCLIKSVDCSGFPAETRTRAARLGCKGTQNKLLMFLTPPVQSLPTPATIGTTPLCGNVNYCNSAKFGSSPPGISVPAGLNYFVVTLINGANRQEHPSGSYSVYVVDRSTGTGGCAIYNSTQNRWEFTATANHYYKFVVYFNCPAPGAPTWPNVSLDVKKA